MVRETRRARGASPKRYWAYREGEQRSDRRWIACQAERKSAVGALVTPERWKQIDDVFHHVHELEPHDRAVYLDDLRSRDVDLHVEVTSLLDSEDQAAAVLHETIGAGAGQLIADGATAMIGQRLGAYRLVTLIGEGGMGSVFRAVRDDAEYRSEVAVKVLRHGLGSPHAVARFRDERQILAALDHPGVVRLLDGGSTEAGTPYLVLEYVQGVAITRYARERELSVKARVELMIPVCEAVQYAHQQLIVHRDIKPSNIVVGERGVPKLLDFGIAKLLDPTGDDERAAKTRTGMALLTPEYASPEQARSEPVSTATDVYSLGAVLYELLANRPPHRATSNSLEALRMICEVEPEPPSAVAPADRRGAIEGDLDNIVQKALQKDPAQRYATAAQLADDLRRHLGGQPVLARAATFGYRARKYVRRNRGKLAIAAAVTTALIAATVWSTSEARRADHEAARARHQFAEGRKLANTLVYEIESQVGTLKGATVARELILRSALDYLDALAEDVGKDAGLSREIALGYMRLGDVQGGGYEANLGRSRDALVMYAKARAILDRMTTERDTPATRQALATYLVGAGIVHQANNEVSRARDLLREGLTLSEALPAGYRLAPALAIRAYHVSSDLAEGPDVVHDLDRAGELAAQWLAADPASDDARYWTGIIYMDQSRLAGRRSDPANALAWIQKSIPIFRGLSDAHRDDERFSRDLAVTNSDLAGYLAGISVAEIWVPGGDDTAGGEAVIRDELAAFEEMHRRDPADMRASADFAAETATLASIVAKRDPAGSLEMFERSLEIYNGLPQTARDEFYTRQMEWFTHCAMSIPLATLHRVADANVQAKLGLEVASVVGPDGRGYGTVEMCRYMVAQARHVAGDEVGAAELLDANVATLDARVTQATPAINDLIGEVESLELLAAVRPASACQLRRRAADAWRAWHARTSFVERRQAELDRRAICRPT
jgi:hypothetical protein